MDGKRTKLQNLPFWMKNEFYNFGRNLDEIGDFGLQKNDILDGVFVVSLVVIQRTQCKGLSTFLMQLMPAMQEKYATDATQGWKRCPFLHCVAFGVIYFLLVYRF